MVDDTTRGLQDLVGRPTPADSGHGRHAPAGRLAAVIAEPISELPAGAIFRKIVLSRDASKAVAI